MNMGKERICKITNQLPVSSSICKEFEGHHSALQVKAGQTETSINNSSKINKQDEDTLEITEPKLGESNKYKQGIIAYRSRHSGPEPQEQAWIGKARL